MNKLVLIFCFAAVSATGHDCLWWWTNDPSSDVLNIKAASFHICLTGPNGMPTACCKDVFDVDDDGDVDLSDFARFTVCITDIHDERMRMNEEQEGTQEAFLILISTSTNRNLLLIRML